MTRNEHVYRLVIDSYPTPDGLPFTDQPANVWGMVGEPDAPPWLPARGLMRLWKRSDPDTGLTYFVPPDFRRHRRFFNLAPARFWQGHAIALGCTAHVDTAVVGPYRPVRTRKRAGGGDTTTPESTTNATE
ncbi:hypothetical protein [Nocardia wallacei]|uniref:Uncharacterized protein n=1 Tax=Nocardia wallacei TaxID=480035 RepID=A0A7G1KYU9_9NOCA|nr:hypothetical protein [Nocardia wallacei]BCK58344.1 hypothetical protein NWFMUON74_61160 [Nocardia wallacei]